MIELHTGETIWTMSVYWSKHEPAKVYVHRATVLDGENKIVKQHWGSGHTDVRVLDAIAAASTSVYRAEDEAWRGAAAVLSRGAGELTSTADECLRQAAACVVGEAVPA